MRIFDHVDRRILIFDGVIKTSGRLIFKGVTGDLELSAQLKTDVDLPPPGGEVLAPVSVHIWNKDLDMPLMNRNMAAFIRWEDGKISIGILTVEIPVPLPPLMQVSP